MLYNNKTLARIYLPVSGPGRGDNMEQTCKDWQRRGIEDLLWSHVRQFKNHVGRGEEDGLVVYRIGLQLAHNFARHTSTCTLWPAVQLGRTTVNSGCHENQYFWYQFNTNRKVNIGVRLFHGICFFIIYLNLRLEDPRTTHVILCVFKKTMVKQNYFTHWNNDKVIS